VAERMCVCFVAETALNTVFYWWCWKWRIVNKF